MAENKEVMEIDPNTLECEAGNMNINDVKLILDEVISAAKNAERLYPAFIEGFKHDEMKDALDRVVNALRSGRYRDFARKNKWLKTKANEYLNDDNSTQTQDARYAVVGLYRLATRSSDVLDAVSNHIEYFNSVYAMKASEFFTFHSDMEAVFDAGFISRVANAFNDYNYFTNKFNDARIYKDLPDVSKDKAFLDNYKLVTEQMDYEVSNLKNLNSVLVDHFHAAPMEMNRFYILDRLTREFAGFESDLKTGGDTMIATGDKLKAQLAELNGQPEISVGQGFFAAIDSLITKLGYVFLQAQEVIQRYKTSTDAPYGVMQYSQALLKAANDQLFMSLDDPIKSGTKYTDIVKSMISRNIDLAKIVAKNAP
ncbi:MAG: hypothetical protein J6U10_04170 [Lachnospiraceae bacterium]|nr:hypothetical protein [Lachnospiraceae bacterium]